MKTVSQYEILQLHLECLKISASKSDSIESTIKGYNELALELKLPTWATNYVKLIDNEIVIDAN